MSAERVARARHRVTARSVRVALSCIWMLDGLLQLQPKMFGQSFRTGVLEPAAQGQPGFIASPLGHLDHLVGTSPVAFNVLFASVQILIGVGLLVRDTVKPALVASFAWALGVWGLGEGFGMIFTGQASPLTGAPGAVLLYAVIGLLVWPRRDVRVTDVSVAAASGPLGETGARSVWAVLWVAMAVLWLMPANRSASSVSSALTSAASGEPGWLSHLQLAAAHAFSGEGTMVAVVLAIVSILVGLGPLLSRRPTLYLAVGAALSLDFWILGQSFGGLLTGLGTDPNSGPLFILFALAIFLNTAPARSRIRHEGSRVLEPGFSAPR